MILRELFMNIRSQSNVHINIRKVFMNVHEHFTKLRKLFLQPTVEIFINSSNNYRFKMDESLIALSMKANANALKKQFPSPLVLLNFEYLVLRSYNADYDYYIHSSVS